MRPVKKDRATMTATDPSAKRPARRRAMMAVVLGTALTALGTPNAPANETSQPTHRALHDVSRYCTTCWRNARLDPDSWSDCTQEVMTRLLQRITPDAWSRVLQEECDERREFLRAIDTVKKRSQRQRRWAPELAEGVVDRSDLRRRSLDETREVVARAADEVLTDRQQRIVQLSFEGYSVQEIATELRASPERISDEKYKAIRKLRTRLTTSP